MINTNVTAADFPIVLNSSDQPLFVQLYESIKASIVDGTVRHGTVLSSTRDLARRLGLSRHTVLKATKLLVTQGYLDGSEAGLIVSWEGDLEFSPNSFSPDENTAEPKLSRAAERAQRAAHPVSEKQKNCNVDDTVLSNWRKILVDKSKNFSRSTAADSLGMEELRFAVSRYLNRFRSLQSTPDNVVIFPNASVLRKFLKTLLIDSDDSVIVENPASKETLDSLYGTRIAALDVDSKGISVSKLREKEAKCVYVTPTHQNPTGATMALERRSELLSWSRSTGAVVVEDAFDSSFFHKGRPLPPLQSLDQSGSVIYITSFDQIVGQLTNLAFAVFPSAYIPAVRALRDELGVVCSELEQQALATFIGRGLLERHLRELNRELSVQRQQLIIALMKGLGGKISIASESCGTWLTVRFSVGLSAEDIERCADEARLRIESTASSYTSEPVSNQYVIPFDVNDVNNLVASATAFSALLVRHSAEKVATSSEQLVFGPSAFPNGVHRL